MSQNERVFDYLVKHPNGITQFEAIHELGILRLSARISDLRKNGAVIDSERVTVKNRFDENCYVSRYKLVRG